MANETAITWLGHSTFLIDTPGSKRILIDPFLKGNPKCPEDRKTIDRCDLILITHAHTDHCADAIPVAQATGARVITMVEHAVSLMSRGLQNVTEMNKGGTVKAWDIAVTMVHALHSSAVESGEFDTKYAGEPAGFVVRLEDGFTFYHAGDTCVFGDMALIGELYRPELAMLPIGDHYTMGPYQAAKATQLLGVKRVIPCTSARSLS